MSDSFEEQCAWFASLRATLERRFGIVPTRHQCQMLFELIPALAKQSAAADTPERYVELLGHLPVDNALVQQVVRALTIKESYFFRDPSTVETLRARVLPELIARARETRVLRVWSAGSSTGEELYTLAVLLDELLPEHHGFTLRLVGSDIDLDALERARAGIYGTWSLRATSPADVVRVFDRVPQGYRVKDVFRANTTFEPYNLSDPTAPLPAPGEFDLIFCRNVSIYFAGEAIIALHRKLRGALAPQGVWISSPSDPVPSTGWATSVLPGMLLHQRPVQPELPVSKGASPLKAIAPTAPAFRPESQPVSFALKAIRPRQPRAPIASPSTAAKAAEGDGIEAELIARVLQHADEGHVAEALAKAESLAAKHPLNANVHRLLALLHEDAREIEKALAAWKRVLYLVPDDVDAHLRVGLLLGRLGDRAAAVRALRNAVVARERRKLREQSGHVESATADDQSADVAGRLLKRMRGGAG